MSNDGLNGVAHAVVRRAHRQGFVVAREIRHELAQTGIPKTRWKEVLSIASASLRYRKGRYHYRPTLSPRLQEQQRRERDIQKAIAELVRLQKQSTRTGERRRQDRVDFIQPVRIRAENGRELTLLSRDLSKAGIRIIAAESLLGQKLLVSIPCPEEGKKLTFRVRILWTCSIGDGLFENGGSFLELVANEERTV